MSLPAATAMATAAALAGSLGSLRPLPGRGRPGAPAALLALLRSRPQAGRRAACLQGEGHSIMTVLGVAASAARPANHGRAPLPRTPHAPSALSRVRRLHRVLLGPCSAEASRRPGPLRLTRTRPPSPRQPSTQGQAWLLDGSNATRATGPSLSRQGASIPTPPGDTQAQATQLPHPQPNQ